MKLNEATIDKDKDGVYLQLPLDIDDKQRFTDAREFMNAYYAHEAINQLYSQDQRIAELETELEEEVGKSAFDIENMRATIQHLSKENSKLQEQLKNAISLPDNFDIGQKVFMIPTSSNCLKRITAYKILSFSKSDIGLRADLSIVEKEKGIEPYFSADFGEFNTTIFKTEAEAQKYLEKSK